jgi:hypothetical protein
MVQAASLDVRRFIVTDRTLILCGYMGKIAHYKHAFSHMKRKVKMVKYVDTHTLNPFPI